MSSIIEEAKALNSEEIKDVLNVVVSKIEKGELKHFVIRDFYINFESYRDKIANALAKSNIVIGPPEMAALRTMYQTDSKNLENAFDEMLSKGTMKPKVLSDIKKKEA